MSARCCLDRRKERLRINPYRREDVHELNHVQPTLAGLVLAHV